MNYEKGSTIISFLVSVAILAVWNIYLYESKKIEIPITSNTTHTPAQNLAPQNTPSNVQLPTPTIDLSGWKTFTGPNFSIQYPVGYVALGLTSTSTDPKDPKLYNFELNSLSIKQLAMAIYNKQYKSKDQLTKSFLNGAKPPKTLTVAGKNAIEIENSFGPVTNVIFEDTTNVYDLIYWNATDDQLFAGFYNSFKFLP